MPGHNLPYVRHPHPRRQRQRGVALLLVLFVVITLGLAFFFRPTDTSSANSVRERLTEDSLAQAKDALIGFAATYRDTHPNQVFGYLPCTDTDNDGVADTCGLKDVSLAGRLPWKTLGISALRDSASECLWYALSGRAKDTPKTDIFNWDTLGQFIVQDASGATLAGAVAHDRPFAVLLAPRAVLGVQSRPSTVITECGGTNVSTDYLEGLGVLGTGDTTLVVASADSLRSGTNNDSGLWITSKDIFDRVKQRSDFKNDVEALLNDLVICLNSMAVIPAASVTNKGTDNIIAACPTVSPTKTSFSSNWKENLLYAGGPSGIFTVNSGAASCKAVLIFGGERANRTVAPLVPQTRSTIAEKNDPTMYLEGVNATLFPANGAYAGATLFSPSAASADIVRCITGLPAGATQVSFAQNLPSFTSTGAIPTVTTDTTEKTVVISDNGSGTAGGCFWSPTRIPLDGKTLRAYYEYQFSFADTFATSGAIADRGNGFTFQLVRGDIPNGSGGFSQPDTCGTESNLGALNTSDIWGSLSYIVETDIRRNASQNDPSGNHTAIMINGSLNHSGSGGTPTTACNGTTNGCLFNPANTFEESPAPLTHNQRIEIHTGCNSTCTRCDPKIIGTYAKISTWVDCTDCNDVVADLLDSEQITLQANRDFSAPGDWSGTNWSVVSNSLNHTVGATPASLPNSALTAPPATGTSYRIDFVIDTTTAGAISIAFGGNSTLPLNQSVGVASYNLQFDPTSATPLTLTPDANWVGNISRVSVKPVRPPKINRCVVSNPEMSQVFFGLTGGFLSTPDTVQGVTFKNLILRTD
ncbi:hypothetical protein [Propionivibrio sp.]|uniref:hypothetical protein n=1 Tax=Propionivibrio sp. TaxID=2212460 RepID=UPI0025E14462|nr:hypothetical protein [Propionivibrio sp.]MBK8399842.1 hypothetical protein [Propionivibrio sp.]MBK8743268.1 hypothetical protein [Propionivibrio sp.]MBK8894717.1 hypothetical protein [Propionivibrio sp.]